MACFEMMSALLDKTMGRRILLLVLSSPVHNWNFFLLVLCPCLSPLTVLILDLRSFYPPIHDTFQEWRRIPLPVSLVLVVRVEDHREEQRFDSIGSSLPLHRSGEAWIARFAVVSFSRFDFGLPIHSLIFLNINTQHRIYFDHVQIFLHYWAK